MSDIRKSEGDRIKIFDSVRAVATIAVFLFHAGYLFTYSKDGAIDWYKIVASSGTIGVSMFFVLSGFLLFYQLYKKKEPLDNGRLWSYVKKRLLRILPLYYFSLFFLLFTLHRDFLFSANGLKAIIYNMLFLREFHRTGASISIDPVYWTLIIEMHFYVLLPVFYRIFYKYKKAWPFLLLASFGIVYRVAVVSLLKEPPVTFLLLTPASLDFFAFGMLGAYFYVEKRSWIYALGKSYAQLLLVLGFLAFIYFYNLSYFTKLPYVFMPTFFAPIAMLGILSFLVNERTALGRALTCAPIVFVAKISYSVYIWHAIVIGQVERLDLSNGSKIILSAVVTLVVSTITYHAIEAPFLQLKGGKISENVAALKNAVTGKLLRFKQLSIKE